MAKVRVVLSLTPEARDKLEAIAADERQSTRKNVTPSQIAERAIQAYDAAPALVRAAREEGNPLFTCPGCGRDTALVMNGSVCPACMGRE